MKTSPENNGNINNAVNLAPLADALMHGRYESVLTSEGLRQLQKSYATLGHIISRDCESNVLLQCFYNRSASADEPNPWFGIQQTVVNYGEKLGIKAETVFIPNDACEPSSLPRYADHTIIILFHEQIDWEQVAALQTELDS